METKVVKEALPLNLEGNSSKAVLIIHGFTGYTGEFYPLARKLNELGYTVSLPRLPGHGTNRKDFMTTGWRDWLLHVEDCYRDLSALYEDVSLVGLSMGGVLALILASRYSPRRTVLLAPAMAVRNRLFYLTPFLGRLIGPLKKNWEPEPDASEDRKILGQEYWTVDIPRQAAHLRKLQKIAQKEMKAVKSPLLLLLSETDESVPLEAGRVIKAGLDASCPLMEVRLKNSHHVLITGEEKEDVLQMTADWLEERN